VEQEVTIDQFLDEVVVLMVVLLKGLLAALPVLLLVVPALAPLFAGWFRNVKHGQAFATVTRMGLMATNVAADEIRKGLAAATETTSDGGVTITHAEMAVIIVKATAAAFKWAQDNKALAQVLDVYGGKEEVEKAITAMINNKLRGNPVGVTSVASTEPVVPKS
jgi:hypothetical protein